LKKKSIVIKLLAIGDVTNDEELKIKEQLLNELPSQVKLIPMIHRKKMPE
jgi:hypothetical protein